MRTNCDPNFNITDKDDYGYLNIPDESHFYFMMNEDTLFMVDARRNDLAKTHMSIEFKWI